MHSDTSLLIHDFKTTPGVILGPDEALLAMLLCIEEAIAALPQQRKARSFDDCIAKQIDAIRPRLSSVQRQRVIRAYLLYGPFDGRSAAGLLDRYITIRGSSFGRRELLEEVLPHYSVHSPFAHDLESSGFTWSGVLGAGLTDRDGRILIAPLVRALTRAGWTIDNGHPPPPEHLRFVGEGYKSEIAEDSCPDVACETSTLSIQSGRAFRSKSEPERPLRSIKNETYFNMSITYSHTSYFY